MNLGEFNEKFRRKKLHKRAIYTDNTVQKLGFERSFTISKRMICVITSKCFQGSHISELRVKFPRKLDPGDHVWRGPTSALVS